MSHSISFMYWGQVPSKSNYRWANTKAAKKRWMRIKLFEEELGYEAARAWRQKYGKPQHAMLVLGPPISVEIEPYSMRIDANNISKGALDALEGICYANDKDVGCNIHPMTRDKKGARMYVTVRWGAE